MVPNLPGVGLTESDRFDCSGEPYFGRSGLNRTEEAAVLFERVRSKLMLKKKYEHFLDCNGPLRALKEFEVEVSY